jgi:hypothetical protein
MADTEVDVSHTAISRALASLGERAGGAEVGSALDCDWEPFEAQMRRRMRTRSRENREAYLCLAHAGSEKVRIHLEATGVIPRREERPRRRCGAVVRVRDRRRRLTGRRGGRGRGGVAGTTPHARGEEVPPC